MEDKLLTAVVVLNGMVSLTVLYFVAPLYTVKGKLCMLIETIRSHDYRIRNIEERV